MTPTALEITEEFCAGWLAGVLPEEGLNDVECAIRKALRGNVGHAMRSLQERDSGWRHVLSAWVGQREVPTGLSQRPLDHFVAAQYALVDRDFDEALHHLDAAHHRLPPAEVSARALMAHYGDIVRVTRGRPADLARVAEPTGVTRMDAFVSQAAAHLMGPDSPPPDVAECPWPMSRVQVLGGVVASASRRGQTPRPAVVSALESAAEHVALSLAPDDRSRFWALQRETPAPARQPTTPLATARTTDADRLLRVFGVLGKMATERDLARLLERITDGAVELTGAERGVVLLRRQLRHTGPMPDADGRAHDSAKHTNLELAGPQAIRDGVLRPVVAREATAPREETPADAFSRSIAEAVLLDGRPIVTVDARNDPRVSEYMTVHRLALTSVACVPIRAPAGTLGVLYLEHRLRPGRFVDGDLELLLAFADQAGIAIETSRAFEEAERRAVELERANRELMIARADLQQRVSSSEQALHDAQRSLDRRRDPLGTGYERYGLVGRSDAMRRVFAVIDRAREVDVPVVLHGESGTGKELLARALHDGGARAGEPFVAISCGAIPDTLIESELFGHVRGAFTGASRARDGAFVRAHGGTLFLDEVADMSPKMQVDLLRVLQDGRVRPVGGDEDRVVDVRIVCASHKSLRDCVQAGTFREDLFYRLNVVEIVVPPLRERPEDIPALALHFLARMARGGRTKRLTRDALEALANASLPGNVRQLEHLLAGADVITGEGAGGEPVEIGVDSLALDALGRVAPANHAPEIARRVQEAILNAVDPKAGEADGNGEPAPPDAPTSLADLKARERANILAALEREGGNRARAARRLGIPRRTFYRRLREHGIVE